MEYLNKIFEEISEYVENKEKIKEKTLNLMKLEREWELGVLSSGVDLP